MRRALGAMAAALLAGCAGAPPAQPSGRHPDGLPRAFLGTWIGVGQSAGPQRAGPAFEMQLRIAPREAPARGYTFEITYGGGAGQQVRPYVLVPADRPGEFDLDERNGVVLRASLIGDTLHCPFAVGGKDLVSRYTLREDHLEVEHVTISRAAPRTGRAEGGPEVASFRVEGAQRALLRRR